MDKENCREEAAEEAVKESFHDVLKDVIEEQDCPEKGKAQEMADDIVEKEKAGVGIFIFLAIMALLIVAAIGFVIYVCCGTSSGCNCGKC